MLSERARPAVDRFNDADRQMTHRCSGEDVAHSNADRQKPEAAEARLASSVT
jgi:hypothetical protein